MNLSKALQKEVNIICEGKVTDAIARVKDESLRRELESLRVLLLKIFDNKEDYVNWFFQNGIDTKKIKNWEESRDEVFSFEHLCRKLQSYYEEGYDAIIKTKVVKFDSIEDLFDHFEDIKDLDTRMIRVENGDISNGAALILECDDRFSWWDIENDEASEEEKESMGNCGRSYTDTLVYLREKIVRNGKTIGFIPRVIASLKYSDSSLTDIECRSASPVPKKYDMYVRDLGDSIEEYCDKIVNLTLFIEEGDDERLLDALDSGEHLRESEIDKALFFCVEHNRISTLKILLDYTVDISTHGTKLLRWLCYTDNVEMLEFVLSSRNFGKTNQFIEVCLGSNKVEMLKIFLDKGVFDENTLEYCLVEASRFGQIDAVRYLMKAVKDINQRESIALHNAAIYGQEDVIRLLIDGGADVNMLGETTLIETAINGQYGALKILLEAGADPKKYEISRIAAFAKTMDLTRLSDVLKSVGVE